MKLPDDLPGGWEFTEPFNPVPLLPGQIWRKRGPVDAFKILRVMIQGTPGYDGGAQGISVLPSRIKGNRIDWAGDSFFMPGTQADIHSHFEASGYALVEAKK